MLLLLLRATLCAEGVQPSKRTASPALSHSDMHRQCPAWAAAATAMLWRPARLLQRTTISRRLHLTASHGLQLARGRRCRASSTRCTADTYHRCCPRILTRSFATPPGTPSPRPLSAREEEVMATLQKVRHPGQPRMAPSTSAHAEGLVLIRRKQLPLTFRRPPLFSQPATTMWCTPAASCLSARRTAQCRSHCRSTRTTGN